jgi:hypothetical protein
MECKKLKGYLDNHGPVVAVLTEGPGASGHKGKTDRLQTRCDEAGLKLRYMLMLKCSGSRFGWVCTQGCTYNKVFEG